MEKENLNVINATSKVKLLCSYGGKIQPRLTDHKLSYIGGDTKILAVDRNVKFSEIATKLNSLCNRSDNTSVSIKYQLPGEDLDALVSLINDEDVEHMMAEYVRMQRISTKPARLRLFIFDSSGPLINSPAKSGIKEPGSELPLNPDYLFGFDKEYQPSIGAPLDLLQIPGMVLTESSGFSFGRIEVNKEITENHETSMLNNVNVNGAAAAAATTALYRLPVTANGGAYHSGRYMFGVVPGPGMVHGIQEQPLYSFVPIMPSVPGQKIIVSAGKNQSMKVNQSKF